MTFLVALALRDFVWILGRQELPCHSHLQLSLGDPLYISRREELHWRLTARGLRRTHEGFHRHDAEKNCLDIRPHDFAAFVS